MTQTAPAKSQQAARLPLVDFIERTLNGEFNRYAGFVGHYAMMESLANTEKGKNKWRFLRRMVQKLKDDILAILYRYQERRSLRDLAAAFQEAQDERRSIITWINSRPQEKQDHVYRAADEIDSFQVLLTGLLQHVKETSPAWSPRRAEAASILATLPK